MEIFGFDFFSLFTVSNLLAIVVGTFVGLLIGALPGLGAMIAIVLLLPITYSMSPVASILMLLAAYQAAEYGGSISSIILGIPGTAAAVATSLDGNPLAKKGYPGLALTYSLTASMIGGFLGGLVLILLSVPLANFALKFSDPEFFLIGILGLLAVASLSSTDITKSAISVVLGLMAGTVGIDMFTGVPRFTLGRPELMEGISMIALIVGLFAFSEILIMVENDLKKNYKPVFKGLSSRLPIKEFKKVIKPISAGSIIGSIVGIVPGMGAGPASWFAYSISKKLSKSPETFGKGNPEGIAGPEAANNATVGGSLIPLISLGIPGSPTMAVIMGAFIIHGIQPGPNIFAGDSTLVYSILYGFLLTTIMMFLLGKMFTPLFSRILTLSSSVLISVVFVFAIMGVFASKGQFIDLWFALIIGVVAYFLRKLEYSMPSFILAFVLAPIIEESFRRSLLQSKGSYDIFFTRPYSISILIIILTIVGISIFSRYKKEMTKESVS